jgi:hypothetical protein
MKDGGTDITRLVGKIIIAVEFNARQIFLWGEGGPAGPAP